MKSLCRALIVVFVLSILGSQNYAQASLMLKDINADLNENFDALRGQIADPDSNGDSVTRCAQIIVDIENAKHHRPENLKGSDTQSSNNYLISLNVMKAEFTKLQVLLERGDNEAAQAQMPSISAKLSSEVDLTK
jgi:hypothetical protein